MRFASILFVLALSKQVHAVDKEFQATLERTSYKSKVNNALVDHRMPPNPKPYRVAYDDGTVSPLIHLVVRGDETDPAHQVYEETMDGFTVKSVKGKYVYLEVNDDTGDYIETDMIVGVDDPYSAHIRKDAAAASRRRKKEVSLSLPPGTNGDNASVEKEDLENHEEPIDDANDDLNRRKLRGQSVKEYEQPHRRTQITSGTLKNLVIPFKFSDHTGRALPTRADLDILMNHDGPHSLAPTGSVRDVYLETSFGKLDLQSTVIDWITIDYTEKYCADGDSGTALFHTCLKNALDKAVAAGVNFADYDVDNNGYIDGMTFFHSGYAAEWGGNDSYGAYYLDRIWSHKWAIYPSWQSPSGVRVYEYHVNPAVWGTSGSSIGRIGVVAHETGHFLGLPDLYDYGDGDGIGSWGLMANSWGFNYDQKYPPIMSAWSKRKLDWVTPSVVSTSGTYSLRQSCDNGDMIIISAGFPAGEYLLIENRQPCGFDEKVPQGGLAIFHIDDNANNIRGYPGQSGWPTNGNHYEVALLQADGDYQLEKGNNRGDSGDLFHAGGVNSIGPGGTSNGKSHPNTNAYQGGNIIDTKVTISNISAASSTMTFDIQFEPKPPTLAPTPCGDLAVQVSVTSDNYPSEITWTVEDASGGIVESDGGEITADWTEYTNNFCLDTEACYTFTIFDSYEDGIFDPGTFSLVVDGEVKLSHPNEGYSSLSATFGDCGSTSCTDRTDQWTIDGTTKYWCTWAGTKRTTKRCANRDLYNDCPVTCSNCPSSCTDRIDSWTIGDVTRSWCIWAGNKNTANRCANKDLYTDCPVTCDNCPP